MNLDELVDFVYEKLDGKIDKETLLTIFELETDYMIEIGLIEEQTEGLGDEL